MRSYHRITRDAKRQGWSNGMASSTRCDTVCQIKSNYYCNNMLILYLFLTLFWFYNLFWSLIPKKCGNFCHTLCFWFHAWNLLNVTSQKKQVTDVSLVLKDSDTESENLSSLIQAFCIRLPENGQLKRWSTESSKLEIKIRFPTKCANYNFSAHPL